jgi:iron donor protein CyaY
MDEQEFQKRAGLAIEDLSSALASAADRYPVDSDMNAGALAVEFEDPPGKFVVSPQAATRQIWVSAESKSFKFDWNADRNTFVLPDSGQSLKEMMEEAIGRRLGEKISL